MGFRAHLDQHRLLIVIAAVVGVLVLTGCGSSNKAKTTVSSSLNATALKLAACMRAHGVPNFTDPTPSGQARAVHANKRSPAFRSAQRACTGLQTALADFKPRESRATQLRDAQCMRAHGVPDYPDPLPGGGFRIPSTINPQSPAFERAQNSCEPTSKR